MLESERYDGRTGRTWWTSSLKDSLVAIVDTLQSPSYGKWNEVLSIWRMLPTTKKALVSGYVRAVCTRRGGTGPRSRTTLSNMLESDDEVSDEEDSEPSSASNDLNTDADPTSGADNMVPVEPFLRRSKSQKQLPS